MKAISKDSSLPSSNSLTS